MNETALEFNAIEELVSVVVPVFFGMIAVTGLFGNSLVILVVIANPQMRSTTNLLIVNLAVADLLFVIFCIPFTATDYVLSQWPFGDTWCKCVQYLIVLFAHASIYTLVLMSLDRYLAVVHPIRSRSIRTEKYTRMAITILWVVICTAFSPIAFMHGLDYCDSTEDTLCCRFLYTTYPMATFHITFMATSFIVPLVLISGLYIRMIIRLWTTVVGNKLSTESQKGRKRVTRLVVVVVVAFASLWFPIQVILVLKSVDMYSMDSTFKVLLQIFSQTLAYTSACINPLLYAFLSENFRKAFRKAIPCFTKYHGYRSGCQDLPRRSSAGINCTTSI
ncbi:unnamed protein product [Hermetia illucens]|uniref:G-protein coupled receptors family 1 profile domain-containing protein n=1 Tax=Hermetia illucens TaxID=343691 RepID=A0A7R8UZL0_HERIL|nr:allatostatin-A receptor [Hermetia illucens]CAD7089962.1 unnamed protein product [Hermetia illucens]